MAGGAGRGRGCRGASRRGAAEGRTCSDGAVLHRRRGLPEDWSAIVDDRVAIWATLDRDERAAVEADSDWLLRHKHWEAAQGFELTDDIRPEVPK